jgi:predicted  nucleic acid-binding Zn-ribbon protein
VLKQLNESLYELQKVLKDTETDLHGVLDKRAKLEQRRSDAQELRQQAASLLVEIDEALISGWKRCVLKPWVSTN